MNLCIQYPFACLPDVIFEIIVKVQNIKGNVCIQASDTNIAKRWIFRMLSSHRSEEQVKTIFEKLSWETTD